MHAEVEAMLEPHDQGLRGGRGVLTVKGRRVCKRCTGDIKTLGRALDLDHLTVNEIVDGEQITHEFDREDLKTIKDGGKGFAKTRRGE
jgi:hypothetical protein